MSTKKPAITKPSITIEGKEFVIEQLPDQIQNLIKIHTKWTADTEESRQVLAKNEAAVRELSREIIAAVDLYSASIAPPVVPNKPPEVPVANSVKVDGGKKKAKKAEATA